MIALLRATLVHVALVALGGWALWAQSVYRAPQPAPAVVLLSLAGLAILLVPVFWLAQVRQAVGIRARPRPLLQLADRVCALIILGVAFWSLLLYGNGKFDQADPVARSSEIVGIAGGEGRLARAVPLTWIRLRAWEPEGREARLLLRRAERERAWSGQRVVVLVRPGFLGLRWISAIEPDLERPSREILRLAPDAAEVWKALVLFHLRVHRFDEARRVAGEYVARFPRDPEFPVRVAWVLIGHDRLGDVAQLLAPVAIRHEHAGVYMLLGYALGRQGRGPEGLRYLERARLLEPDNWWAHYALGWVHGTQGDTASAVLSFERALQLRPGLADVEVELQRLRPLLLRQRV